MAYFESPALFFLVCFCLIWCNDDGNEWRLLWSMKKGPHRCSEKSISVLSGWPQLMMQLFLSWSIVSKSRAPNTFLLGELARSAFLLKVS